MSRNKIYGGTSTIIGEIVSNIQMGETPSLKKTAANVFGKRVVPCGAPDHLCGDEFKMVREGRRAIRGQGLSV